ncbi:MAG: hypothetical protein L3J96_03550 [Thermoplasmata archaeon]|nr:hypothetical protein [Thermoplasmata archaeon]
MGMAIVYALYAPNAPNLIAPELFDDAGADTVAQLRGLGVEEKVHPETIVVVSPHWHSSNRFLIHRGTRPAQVFDFSGFPPQLSSVRYAPPGDPEMAGAIVAAASQRNLAAATTEEWGLDHGAWAPLMHIAPGASIPVIPMSICSLSPNDHIEMGRSIAEAARQLSRRVAVVATGSITHRLDRADFSSTARWKEGERIEREIVELVLTGRTSELVRFDRAKWAMVAPEGDLKPMFVLLGTLDQGWRARLVSTGQVFGAAGMSVIEWVPA